MVLGDFNCVRDPTKDIASTNNQTNNPGGAKWNTIAKAYGLVDTKEMVGNKDTAYTW